MSRTPAAELARVKTRFAAWSIRPVEPGKGTGYTAQRGRRQVHAPSLADLEKRLLATRGRS